MNLLNWLRPSARSRAITTLCGMVNQFDNSVHSEIPEERIGCTTAPEQFDEGITLCEVFKLNGPEFGVGDLLHFHKMACRAFEFSISKSTAEPEVIVKMNGKLEHLRMWRWHERLKKHADDAAREVGGMSALA